MCHAIVLAVNIKAVQMGIAPPHGDLKGIMEIGDTLIAEQQNGLPDHRAHAPRNNDELVDANPRRLGHRSLTDPSTPVRFPGFPRFLYFPDGLTHATALPGSRFRAAQAERESLTARLSYQPSAQVVATRLAVDLLVRRWQVRLAVCKAYAVPVVRAPRHIAQVHAT
jgi:hypothetical protein